MATMAVKDIDKYPFLIELLLDLKTLPKRRPFVYEKFQEYSDLVGSKAYQALQFGTLPIITVESGSFVWGNYAPDNNKRKYPDNTIALNKRFVDDFEIIGRWHHRDTYAPDKAWEAAVGDAKLMVEAIVLHELVHWGDWTFDGVYKDGLTKEGELGWAFLNDAYKPRKLRVELMAESIRARVERWNQG